MAALARTVRAARRQRGWSQDQLSAEAGISKGAVVALENGTTNPNLSTLCRLSDALHLPIPTLLGQTPSPGVAVIDPAHQTPLWRGPAGGTAVLTLVTPGPAPVELWHWTLNAGERYEHVPYPEGIAVVKTVTVTVGELLLVVDGAEHRVSTGCTAVFGGGSAHAFEARGEHCRLLSTTHLPIGGTW